MDNRKKSQVVVFASIVGDLFHIGHLNFLRQAKALGDYLIVGVLTDRVAESYKRTPIISEEQRMAIIEQIRYVDEVFLQDTLEPDSNFLECRVDIIVCGDDWLYDFPGAEYMRSIGKKAINVPYYPHQSTTKVIKRILEAARWI